MPTSRNVDLVLVFPGVFFLMKLLRVHITALRTFKQNFRFPKDKTGTTKIGDLAPQDMKKIHALALIELTALFDILGIELKPQKAAKIKVKGEFVEFLVLVCLFCKMRVRIPI